MTVNPVIACILCNLLMISLVVSYLGNVFVHHIGAVFPKGPSVGKENVSFINSVCS